MQGKHGHLSREQKQLALRLHAMGWRLVDIAREIGCSAPMVGIMARTGRHLDAKPFGWEPRAGHLTIDERETVLLGLGLGEELRRRLPRTWAARCPRSAERSNAVAAAPATSAARPRESPSPGATPQAVQARRGSAAGRGRRLAGATVVPSGDRCAPTVGSLGRCGDACEPRDDLPVTIRAGTRRAAARAGALPAVRASHTQDAGLDGRPGPNPRHDDDQRASRRG